MRLRTLWNRLAGLVGAELERRRGQGGRSDAPQLEGGGFRRELLAVVAQLEEFNAASEREFLGIGGRLMEFRAATGSLVTGLEQLIGLVQGGRGASASTTFGAVCEHARALEARARRGGALLQSLRKATARIIATFLAFGDNVAQFRVLGSMTRIETARLHGTGGSFEHLADQVTALSARVEERVVGLLEVARGVESQVAAALERIARAERAQISGLPGVLEGASAQMGEIERRQKHATEISTALARGFRKAGEDLDELVTSLQNQDITRQQVEHIIEVLRPVNAPSAGVAELLRLQSAQLEAAGREFAAAVARIERSLSGLENAIGDMSASSRGLLGSEEGESDNYFLALERSLTTIGKTVEECARAAEAARQEANSLATPVGQLRNGLAEVGRLEIEMMRLALNARINAAQLDQAGAPLGILAGALQELLGGAEERSSVAGDSVGAIDGTLAELTAGGGEGGVEVLTRVRESIGGLHASSESSFSRLRQVGAEAARLKASLCESRAEFRAAELYQRYAAPSVAELRRLASACAEPAGPREGADLAALSALYTMHSERAVHSAVVGGDAQPAPSPAAAPPAGAEELGANVELF